MAPPHLVALLGLVVPVGVREVYVTAGVLHDALDVVAAFADDVRVFRVRHVHLECDARALYTHKHKHKHTLIKTACGNMYTPLSYGTYVHIQ